MKKALLFKRLFREGKYLRGQGFSVRFLENRLDHSRLGISVQSKLFPKAVQRNRIKRLIRQFFRCYKHDLNNNYDIIIRPKTVELNKLGYKEVEARLLELFKTSKILK